MAALPNFVSVREYLSTSYEPDCDYVDGRLEERNLGEHDHALLQTLLASIFTVNRAAWGVYALTDCRVQTKPTHFRVPDLTVRSIGSAREPILTHPPLLVIEILSPEDRLNAMANRCRDYVEFGIEHIWIIDPQKRAAYLQTATGLELIENGELTISGTPIRIVLNNLFAELDAI
jgi:Uma2 family endonuclease